jgi:hypothetical protein
MWYNQNIPIGIFNSGVTSQQWIIATLQRTDVGWYYFIVAYQRPIASLQRHKVSYLRSVVTKQRSEAVLQGSGYKKQHVQKVSTAALLYSKSVL